MTLGEFSRLTEFELINLYDIQSCHARQVVMHTIQGLERADESGTHNEDDEVLPPSCMAHEPRHGLVWPTGFVRNTVSPRAILMELKLRSVWHFFLLVSQYPSC